MPGEARQREAAGGRLQGALAAYQESLDIARKLAAQDPGNAKAQRDVSVGLSKLGNVKLQDGDLAGALAAYQESLDIDRKLAAQDPGNAQAQRDVVGEPGQARRREAAERRSGRGARRLPGEPRHRPQARGAGPRQRAGAARRVGEPGQARRRETDSGDRAGALAAYQESLDIDRKLAAQDPGNAQAQRDVVGA